MCEIWEEIKRKGIQEGIQEGIKEGRKKGRQEGLIEGKVQSIQKIIEKGYTLEEAFHLFDIPEEERPIYIQRIIS